MTDCSVVPRPVTLAAGVPQLWFTASVKGEERALHHRAGLQHIKAVAARQCAVTPVPLAHALLARSHRQPHATRLRKNVGAPRPHFRKRGCVWAWCAVPAARRMHTTPDPCLSFWWCFGECSWAWQGVKTRAQHGVWLPGRELAKTLALVEKVSGTFSRRDPMRRYMDQIVAMAAASGEPRPRLVCEEAVATCTGVQQACRPARLGLWLC